MFEPEEKEITERDRELFLGHLVTWGSIIIGLGLAIALAPVIAADKNPGGAVSGAEAMSENGQNLKD